MRKALFLILTIVFFSCGDAKHYWSPQAQRNFMINCDFKELYRFCQCAYKDLQERYTEEEFSKLDWPPFAPDGDHHLRVMLHIDPKCDDPKITYGDPDEYYIPMPDGL